MMGFHDWITLSHGIWRWNKGLWPVRHACLFTEILSERSGVSEPPDPEKEAKRDRRRFWWLSSGLLVLLLSFLSYIVLFYDIAPPYDEWILPDPSPPVAGGTSDSIPEFVKKNKVPLDAAENERGKLSEGTRKVTADHVAEAKTYLGMHHAALDDFNAFLSSNQGPLRFSRRDETLDLTGIHYNNVIQSSVLKSAANLADMQARLLAREGDIRESVKQSLALIRLGKQLTAQNTWFLHWHTACALQEIGRSALEDAAHLHAISEDDMRRIEDVLLTSELTSQDFKPIFKEQYAEFKRDLAEASTDPAFWPAYVDIPPWMTKTIKANLTLDLLLEWHRPILLACDQGWCQTLSATRQLDARLQKFRDQTIQRYLSANIGGNFLAVLFLESYEESCERVVRTVALNRQMRIILALRSFEMEHATLPGNLEELCPKHLTAVPLDPYNDRPMLWDATTKAVYSTGEDLADNGGDISYPTGRPTRAKDLGMFYWWKDTPK